MNYIERVFWFYGVLLCHVTTITDMNAVKWWDSEVVLCIMQIVAHT